MQPIKMGKFISTITITIGPAGLGLNKLLWKSLWTHISHHSFKLIHQSSSDRNFFVTRTTHKVSKFTLCAKSCHNPSRYGLQITFAHSLDHLLFYSGFHNERTLGLNISSVLSLSSLVEQNVPVRLLQLQSRTYDTRLLRGTRHEEIVRNYLSSFPTISPFHR